MHARCLKRLKMYIWNIKMLLKTDEENKVILLYDRSCYVTVLQEDGPILRDPLSDILWYTQWSTWVFYVLLVFSHVTIGINYRFNGSVWTAVIVMIHWAYSTCKCLASSYMLQHNDPFNKDKQDYLWINKQTHPYCCLFLVRVYQLVTECLQKHYYEYH